MYVCDIREPGFYTDIMVKRLEDLSFLEVIFLKEAGIVEEPLSGTKYRLRRRKSPGFRGSTGVLSIDNAGEETNTGVAGILNRPSNRLFRFPSYTAFSGFRLMVRRQRNKGGEDKLEPRTGRLQGGNVRDRTVKLDIDVPTDYYKPEQVLSNKLKMLKALGYDYVDAEWKLSPSGHHIHVIIELDREIPIDELFYLQFILGDDPKRATLNFYRLKYFPDNAKYFNVLFEKKVKVSFWLKLKVLLMKVF